MGKLNIDLLKGIEEQEKTFDNSRAYQEEETFLNLLKQEKNHKEAYEVVGREKTWENKLFKKIMETEPERLEGIVQEIKEEPQDTLQTAETSKEKKAREKANPKKKKQVFSFRAPLDNISNWKAYATATGQTMENIGTAAMNEYLENHKLTGAEQSIFEAIKARN